MYGVTAHALIATRCPVMALIEMVIQMSFGGHMISIAKYLVIINFQSPHNMVTKNRLWLPYVK
jgi:hypothetical protein